MQGYLTPALEAHEQMRALGADGPTHLLLQAGVGSFAGAVSAYFANACAALPRALVVEPRSAACIFTSLRAGDGGPHAVTSPMKTMMAGLACGEPCSLGWEVLRAHAAARRSGAGFRRVRGRDRRLAGVADALVGKRRRFRPARRPGAGQPLKRAFNQHRGRHRARALPSGASRRQPRRLAGACARAASFCPRAC